jgi:hypothetical protein
VTEFIPILDLKTPDTEIVGAPLSNREIFVGVTPLAQANVVVNPIAATD